MRFASYNIEWMNGLFENAELQLDDKISARENTTRKEQALAIAEVFRAVDADVFLILEAPNDRVEARTTRALENFAKAFNLRQNTALSGYASGTDQEIALLYDPNIVKARYQSFAHMDAPAFNKTYHMEIAGHKGQYQFSKPPLEAQIIHKETDFAFRLIGAHLKSKAPHGASNLSEEREIALANRRKQIAQATWIRKRADHMHFPFLVAGDFNDGPGFDEFEAKLNKSAVDILTAGGKLYDPAIEGDFTRKNSTSRFLNHVDQSYKEAFLDFIFASKEMRPFAKEWHIWHPLHDEKLRTNPKRQNAFLTASDHFPVSLDLVFPKRDA